MNIRNQTARAIAALCLLLPTTYLGARRPLSYEQFEKKAWADGKIDAAERAQFEVFSTRGRLEAAREYAAKKFAPKDIEPAIRVSADRSSGGSRPWIPMTATKANREVEPDARKARWHHSALVDYDGDGVLETARLSHNGSQMAVVVESKGPRPRKTVVWESDQIYPDVEIYSAGRRIMMNWPDLGYKMLMLHKGQRSVVHIGD